MPSLTAARGLKSSSSILTKPDGALIKADNVVIDFDSTIQKRRGFAEYNSLAFSGSSKQIITYRSRILVHYENNLAFDASGSGSFSNFSGSYSELINGMRLKAVEANGNLYFTSSTGIKKISAKTAADIATDSVKSAGGAKAIGLSGKAVPDVAGFLPAQSKVAYRLVFGTKDTNGSLIIGSPSSRLIITNASQDISREEIFSVDVINYAGISDTQYFLFSADVDYFVYFDVSGSSAAPVSADTINRQPVKVSVPSSPTNSKVAAAIASAISTQANGVQVLLNGTKVEVTVSTPGNKTDASNGDISTSNVLVSKIFDGSVTKGTTCLVNLTATLPHDATTNHFYQLYRTATQTVSPGLTTLNDLEPGDEGYFIYEAPVTSTDVTNKYIEIEDNTPDIFRESGAYLYTNATTGSGIISANEKPPVAADIALFRNSVFFANTKDTHRLNLNMLSVDDFTPGTTLSIGRAGALATYTFKGVPEVTNITVLKKSETVGNSYFEINSAGNERGYYVWFDKGSISKSFNSTSNVSSNTITITDHGFANYEAVTFVGTLPGGLSAGTVYYVIRISTNTFRVSATPGGSTISLTPASGTATVVHTPSDPLVAGKLSIRIPFALFEDSVNESKLALIFALSSTADFDAVDFSSSVVRVTCKDSGSVNAPILSSPSPGWTLSVVTEGEGENVAAKEVLLSSNSSVGLAIDSTARSLVRAINSDANSPVTAQYMTGADELPGKILLEAKTGEDSAFYLATSNAALLSEYSPELTQSILVVSSIDDTFTTSTNHGLVQGDEVFVHTTEVSGTYTVLATPSPTVFKIDADVDAGSGMVFKTTAPSDNNIGPNRIYFSKPLQPEAVPINNYIDVGSKDKPILRILPLRDNLFILKEDGIYILTGDVAPKFTVRLLDNSATLIAPDSAVVLNNLIYALTSQGVVAISETGVSIISRDIEDLIKKVTTFAYNFKFTSFGVAYESDRAYLLWLPTIQSDNVATQCYRYNSVTNTWTRWVLTSTCGQVHQSDDRLYIGNGKRNFVEQERKSGTREDYADRTITRQIGVNAISELNLKLSSVSDVGVGDVIIQNQYVTVAKFNRLLKKLDKDFGVTNSNYYTLIAASAGDNLANKITDLANKLNSDPALFGSFTSASGINSPEALQVDFNSIVSELNSPASGTTLKTYKPAIDLIPQEVLITGVSSWTNSIEANFMLPFVQGDVTIYKTIECEVQWAPQHFGKPETLKQIREGTLLFELGSIYSAVIGFATDRSASFEDIAFKMQGPGFWVSYDWANTVWGGSGNSIPLRTLIPLQKSRCRYMTVRFKHSNAREAFKLLGISLEVREVSTRAYR